MNSEWRQVPIGSICEGIYDGPHATPKKTTDGPVFLGIANLASGRLDLTQTEHLSEEDFKTWTRRVTPQEDDLVFSYETRLGEVALLPKGLKCCLGRRMALMRVNRVKADPTFLLYAYLGNEFQEVIRSRTVHGSTVDRIPLIDFGNFPITVPPLAEQKAIARILRSLDDKIELNGRMNATLEAMAQTLFRAWFVEFEPVKAKAAGHAPVGLDAETAALFPSEFENDLPKGWQFTNLESFIDFALGGDWGKDQVSMTETEVAFCVRGADIPDLQAGGIGKTPTRYLKKSSLEKRSLLDGDLVVEISGGSPTQSTGRPVLVTKHLLSQLEHPLVTSNFCRMVRFKEKMRARYIYLWLRDLYARDALYQFETGTTGIKNFAFSLFCQQAPLVLPPLEVADAFDTLLKPIFEQVQANGAQSRILAQIRDTLLPRLISGQLRVPEAMREVEANI